MIQPLKSCSFISISGQLPLFTEGVSREGYQEGAEMEPSLQIKMHAAVEREVNEKIC